MKGRNVLALVILVVGAAASFYCYTRLNQLLPMQDESAVTRTTATVGELHIPLVKKGQSRSDVKSDVNFSFEVAGQTYHGSYSLKGADKAVTHGMSEPIVYLTQHPSIFLREAEYNDLPRQLHALRWMMMAFGLAAMLLPFAVMKHGA